MHTRRKTKLDLEERETLAAFEKAFKAKTIKSVPKVNNEINKIKTIVKHSSEKKKVVQISISENDFDKAQMRAAKNGITYQVLLSGVLHRYLSGKLVDKRN